MSIITTVLGLGGQAVKVGAGLLGPRLYVEAAIAAVLLATIGGLQLSRHGLQVDVATAQLETVKVTAAWNAQVAEGTRVAFVASEIERAKETRREAERKENVDEAQRMAARSRVDGVAADAAHGRLLDWATATARAAGGRPAGADPAAADRGAPAEGAGLLLPDVLGKSDQRSGLLARYADEARIAGQACERAYDSIFNSNEVTHDAFLDLRDQAKPQGPVVLARALWRPGVERLPGLRIEMEREAGGDAQGGDDQERDLALR